jgi:hypothetical protein
MTEHTTQQDDVHQVQEPLLLCPICNILAGRRIRGKIYCGNCGFIES